MQPTTRSSTVRLSWERIRSDLADLAPGRRWVIVAALATFVLSAVAGLVGLGYLWQLTNRLPRAPFAQPSRLYGRPAEIAVGQPASLGALVQELEESGYRESEFSGGKDEKDNKDSKDGGDDGDRGTAGLAPGTFRRSGGALAVHLRRFPTPDGPGGGVPVTVTVGGDGPSRIESLEVDGEPAERVTLEPPLLASYYSPSMEERRPVRVDELPEEVVRAVLAAEDDDFYAHAGLSPTGIARAAWTNLHGGAVQQGGSTITQQLVKNVYLTPERTLTRKLREAVFAMVIEARFSKKTILESYLNEVYWGASDHVNLIGLGAAARAYFGKDASELTLAEAATLGGMIQAPADYSPVAHPEEARERRDWVLERMAELGWIDAERARRVKAEPVHVDPQPLFVRRAPYLAQVVAAEARERFELDELADEGYMLFSTVSWREQQAAEQAVGESLDRLERTWEKNRRGGEPLQAALVSVDPRDGAVLAWVGGRDWELSQFDRVAQARRQAGSTAKPIVFAAAFAEGLASPATRLNDSPIVVKTSGTSWRPQNDDRAFRGWVTARTALEQSLNIPTVRLALQAGLSRIVDLAEDMGVEGPLETVPAIALGAFEVAPLELAEVFVTLAAGGTRSEVHAIGTVLDRGGEPVIGDDLASPERVLDAQSAYLVTSLLQGVLDRGTGASARRQGVRGGLAGKTGTTSGRRDSWFAGYSPDRVTVVWVGYDDNRRTRLSGSRAAVPIWSRFTREVRPAAGYPAFEPPPGIATVLIDAVTGELATDACPAVMYEVFPEWQAPRDPCRQHAPYGSDWQVIDGVDPYALGLYGEEDSTEVPVWSLEGSWPDEGEGFEATLPGDFEEWGTAPEGEIEIHRSNGEQPDPVLDLEPVPVEVPAAEPVDAPEPEPVEPSVAVEPVPVEPVPVPADTGSAEPLPPPEVEPVPVDPNSPR